MSNESAASPATELSVRKAAIGPRTGPASLDAERGTVEAVLATQAPVLMLDPDRGVPTPEILVMKGVTYPRSVPLLDHHRRDAVSSILGSVRDLRVEGDRLVGNVHLAKGSGVRDLVQDGHLETLSIGYAIRERTYVPRGSSQVIEGKHFAGPVSVVTKWELREASLVSLPADPSARFRSQGAPRKEGVMPQEPITSNDSTNIVIGSGNPAETSNRASINAYVRGACEALGQRHAAHALISEAPSSMEEARARIDDLRAHVQNAKAAGQRDLPFAIERLDAGAAQADKHRAAIESGMSHRVLVASGVSAETIERHLPKANRAPGWEDFRNARLIDVARSILEDGGANTRRLSDLQVAEAAMGNRMHLRADPAFHVSGHFPALISSLTNVSLLAAWEEANPSYRTVFTAGAPANDFKNIHRVRLSESPNLPRWQDNTAPEEVALTDERESYACEAYSEQVSFSYKMVVNDNLSAISRVPADLARAAARTVNALAWSVVTANPTLQDGVALFSAATGNRKKANTSTGVISVTNLGAARSIMRLQVGVNTKGGNASQAILNLTPRYLVVPAALETLAQQIVTSISDPAAALSAGVANPFRGLEVVVEPLLDAASALQWYLFAPPSEATTVEYCYLAGNETPSVRTWVDDATLSLHYAVLTTFGCKAVDFRGAVRSTGA